MHAERSGGKAIGGSRRRPRSEWVIKDDTHEALITRRQADMLLVLAEMTGQPWRDRAPAEYLLSGMLRDSHDNKWQGCRDGEVRYYRLRRRIRADKIEKAIVKKIGQDLVRGDFVESLLKAARRMEDPELPAAELARAWSSIEALDKKIKRVTGMLGETDAQRPLLEQIEKWEAEREDLRAGIIDKETWLKNARLVAGITARDIERILKELADNMAGLEPAELRDFLRTIIDRVTIDPVNPLRARIHYRIPAVSGDKLASPRRTELIPALFVDRLLRLVA